MGWLQGIPFLGRMPEAYRDREETSWLTAAWDELLIETRDRAQAVYATHLDPVTADPENLDWLAQHFGFTEEFWDETWTAAVKRSLMLNAYSFIWVERGTERVINWMLALHQIPAILPTEKIYYPDWYRAFDWVLVKTRDFAENWSAANGTTADLLIQICAALEIDHYTITEDTIVLAYGGDGLHRADLEQAISLYKLPYNIAYNQFYAGFAVAGDPTFEPVLEPPVFRDRLRTHPDVQAIHYPALRDPFFFSIRLNSELVRRGDPTWVLADRLSDTYAPLYMKGGVCFEYFRAGMSAASEPTFDPDYDFTYPLVSENKELTTLALFDLLILAYGWQARLTQTSQPSLLIRFSNPTLEPDRSQLTIAQKLIDWYSPWDGNHGSQVAWEYFYAGLSQAGEPTFDWLFEKLEEPLSSIVDPLERVRTILSILEISVNIEIADPYVLIPLSFSSNQEVLLTEAIARYAPQFEVVYVHFYVGKSSIGDPVF